MSVNDLHMSKSAKHLTAKIPTLKTLYKEHNVQQSNNSRPSMLRWENCEICTFPDHCCISDTFNATLLMALCIIN
ncbi:hypothetical protein L596_022868 [Steinernema carpocapsae]|uniref:Uncharacterized protein n=1 Tax=Steinernema carpocapsae TaxID=34508 RepID=A0A4U5MBW3_STECR|nr:hypothetical protein L596_022868 [Steinernema carpocapsae]